VVVGKQFTGRFSINQQQELPPGVLRDAVVKPEYAAAFAFSQQSADSEGAWQCAARRWRNGSAARCNARCSAGERRFMMVEICGARQRWCAPHGAVRRCG